MKEEGQKFDPEAGASLQKPQYKESILFKKDKPTQNQQQKQQEKLKEQEPKIQLQNVRQLREYQQLENNFGLKLQPLIRLGNIPQCRLDESMCETFQYEIQKICEKFLYILIPIDDKRTQRLRKWDLWGPFVMVLIYLLVIDDTSKTLYLVASVLVGAGFVSFNLIALGGQISYFQSMSILGYCIFPIFAALIATHLMGLMSFNNFTVNKILIFGAAMWATFSASLFIGINVPENRKFIATFPAFLFYAYISIFMAFS